MRAVVLILISSILQIRETKLEEIRQIVQCPRASKGQNQYSSWRSLTLKCIRLNPRQARDHARVGKLLPRGYRISVSGDKKVLENSGDGYTTLRTYLRLQNCLLKNAYSGKLHITYILHKHTQKMPGKGLKGFLNNLRSKTDMDVRNQAGVSN